MSLVGVRDIIGTTRENSSIYNTLGGAVGGVIYYLGYSRNKLATLSGITQSTLNSMMRGETKNPKLKTLRKIL